MSSYFAFLKSIPEDVLKPTFQDFMRSIPDTVFLGTGLIALITQNFPLGIMTLAMMEFAVIHRLLGSFITAIQGTNSVSVASQSAACYSGLPSPYMISVIGQVFHSTVFPSGPLFFLSSVISYTLNSILNFRPELNELSKKQSEWNARIPMAIGFSILLLSSLSIWRIKNSCDTPMGVLGTVLFGTAAGGLVYLLHNYLFGRDAINFLGLPLLQDRAASGKPLYVCAPK
jgi:hypothetical protein